MFYMDNSNTSVLYDAYLSVMQYATPFIIRLIMAYEESVLNNCMMSTFVYNMYNAFYFQYSYDVLCTVFFYQVYFMHANNSIGGIARHLKDNIQILCHIIV